MNIASIVHISKSSQVYAYDLETLHVRIKTGKGEVDKITVKAGDPFDWLYEEKDDKWVFDYTSVIDVEMKLEASTKYHDVWFAELTGFVWRRIRYAFVIEGKDGQKILYGCHTIDDLNKEPEKFNNVFNYFNFPYINEKDVYTPPTWTKDAIWYQISPSSYSNDGVQCKDYYEGNFKGITKKLDYISEMGFNAIYLNPVFESPSWHKYDTTDYYEIDSDLGTKEDFKEFIDKAHSLGIKVILDAVFNHCGYEHAFWKDVVEKGKDSPYYDYFYVLEDSKPLVIGMEGKTIPPTADKDELKFRTFAYEQAMPKWRTSNPAVREHLIGAAAYWTREFNVDGWRLDVSNEVSHDFWREFRRTIKAINSDAYILGENWDDSNAWLAGDQYDAVMNYEFTFPVWNFFGSIGERINNCNATGLKEQLSNVITNYPRHLAQNMFTTIATHDTDRALSICNGIQPVLKLMYLVMFTYTGAPCIFYGDEIGMTGEEMQSRTPMLWNEAEQDLDMQNHVKKLISLRKKHTSFKEIDFNWILNDDEQGVIIYQKSNKDETINIIINNSDKESIIDVVNDLKGKKLYDVYMEKSVNLEDSITLKPYEFCILQEI